MSDLGQAVTFAASLYRERARIAYNGHLRRQPMALLQLSKGRADPYPLYEQIRRSGPLAVYGNDWSSVSHRVCGAVLRDRRFGTHPDDGTGAEGSELSFLGMNPPDHTRLRRLAAPAFSPKAVASYAGRIESTVGALLDQAEAAGEFDLVSGFAAPLPIAVITDLLGVPDSDSAAFARYGALIGSALGGIRSLRHASQLAASEAPLLQLFQTIFELRRRDPRDDIVSSLVAAPEDQIKPAEMVPVCLLLLVAGFETTVNLIGNSVLALLRHPEQWRALCADPEAMAPKAVEETLRYDPPVQLTSRFALQPVELEGKAVAKGESVTTLIGGANRDPEVYDRPGTFDINRDAVAGERGVSNLAFSSGIHYCLGQPLARLEATTALRMLAERLPQLSLAGPVRRRSGFVIRGPLSVPVRVGAPRTVVSATGSG
jgi:cytochrome P450